MVSPFHHHTRPIKQLDYVRDFSVGQLRYDFNSLIILWHPAPSE
jgi:hypothetical protein